MTAERVLVFPREAVLTLGPFTPWVSAGLLLDGVGSGLRWVTRYEAENSSSLVQPIPCAFVSDGRERYLLLRRGPDGREDLRGRLSLVVGGHVDYEEGVTEAPFAELLVQTLARELQEEIGLAHQEECEPTGILVDTKSVAASRHIAFLFRVEAEPPLNIRAEEEFLPRSGLPQFVPVDELSVLKASMDPWSRILLERYLA